MDLADFLQHYTDDVYTARDPEAAARYIADPCLRHEHGHLVTMSLAENVARVRAFLDTAPAATFTTRVVVQDGEFVTGCYDVTIGAGEDAQVLSGIEVFRVVDGKIAETWNSTVQPGAWG